MLNVRQVERSWWLHHPRYVAYMIRELTSLFVGIHRGGPGGRARQAFARSRSMGRICRGALQSPRRSLSIGCLVFAIYHSVTWFALTPKAMPLRMKMNRCPRAIVRRPLRRLGGGVDRVDSSGECEPMARSNKPLRGCRLPPRAGCRIADAGADRDHRGTGAVGHPTFALRNDCGTL